MKAGLTDAYEQIEERDERIGRMRKLLDAAAQRLRVHLEEVHPVSHLSSWRGDLGVQGGQSTSAAGPCQPGCPHEAAAMRRLAQELRAAREASEKEMAALKAELVGVCVGYGRHECKKHGLHLHTHVRPLALIVKSLSFQKGECVSARWLVASTLFQ